MAERRTIQFIDDNVSRCQFRPHSTNCITNWSSQPLEVGRHIKYKYIYIYSFFDNRKSCAVSFVPNGRAAYHARMHKPIGRSMRKLLPDKWLKYSWSEAFNSRESGQTSSIAVCHSCPVLQENELHTDLYDQIILLNITIHVDSYRIETFVIAK